MITSIAEHTLVSLLTHGPGLDDAHAESLVNRRHCFDSMLGSMTQQLCSVIMYSWYLDLPYDIACYMSCELGIYIGDLTAEVGPTSCHVGHVVYCSVQGLQHSLRQLLKS